ncbi:MAG: hypothetical protein WD378_02700, partial [Egicoccus sp.]
MSALGDALINGGVLSPEQLRWAEDRSSAGEGSLPKVLLDHRLAGEPDLVRALATTLGMPYAEVDAAHVDPHAAALLAAEVARELHALPVGFGDGDEVVVAIADPHDPALRDRLTQELAMPVRLALAPRRALAEAIDAQVPAGAPAGAGAAAPTAPPPSGAANGNGMVTGTGTGNGVGPAPSPMLGSDGLVPSETGSAIDLDELLIALVEAGGSDLHLTAGIPPTIRVH